MKIERQKLLDHLEGIYCGDMIPEAVFSGPFATVAKSPDGTVIVETAGLEGVEDLGVAAGFSVKILSAALREELVADVEVGLSQRLLVTVGKITLALVTTDPANTITKVPDPMINAVRNMAAIEGEGYPLDPAGIKSFLGLQKLLPKAEEVRIVLGAKSGFKIGKGTEHQGQVEMPGVVVEGSTSRLLPAHSLKTVLSIVGPDARIWFGPEPSPHGVVTIKDGDRTYYLSVLAEDK